MFSDRVLEPMHANDSSLSGLQHDFVIGGMTLAAMSRKYSFVPPAATNLSSKGRSTKRGGGGGDPDKGKSPYALVQKVGPQFKPGESKPKDNFQDSALVKNARKLASMHLKETEALDSSGPSSMGDSRPMSPDKFSATAGSLTNTGALTVVQPTASLAGTASGVHRDHNAMARAQVEESFIMNADMRKIRQCELVLLKEEEKFGSFKRDPDGRIIPTLQADTLILGRELAKDDRRPIDQPSETNGKIAVHAQFSDVGVASAKWIPEEEAANKLASAQSELMTGTVDSSVVPRERGKQKLGGHLEVIQLEGTETKARTPLIPSLAGEMEFNRARRKKKLGDRLSEIAELREKIQQEKAALDKSVADTAAAERRKHAKSVKKTTKTEDLLSRLGGKKTVHHSASVGSVGSLQHGDSLKHPGTAPEGSRSLIGSEGSAGDSGDPLRSASAGTVSREEAKNLSDISAIPAEMEKLSIDSGSNEGLTPEGSTEDPANGVIVSVPKEPEDPFAPKYTPKQVETKKVMHNKLEEMGSEEEVLGKELYHLSKVDKNIRSLKNVERKSNNREKSREIERKRRLLTEKEGRRKGPPVDEPTNQYDYYVTRLQKCARGFVGRRFAKRHRMQVDAASVKLQAGFRGMFARTRVRTMRLRYNSATHIQANYRGWKARGVSASLAKGANLNKAAKVLQRVWRGVMGCRRAKSKRRLDEAAEIAMRSVDPTILFASDVKEMGKKIQLAIIEPFTTTFPPDEVLHLIRLVVMVLQTAKGTLGLTEYSGMNLRFYNEVDGEHLTWQQASMMCNRSERFIRLLRGIAFGSAAKPPRLIQIPGPAHLLHAAMSMNPKWCEDTFLSMGMGAKLCVQVFRWLNSIIEVATRQAEFVGFITSSFPDWLPKLHEMQRHSRQIEAEIVIDEKALSYLQEVQNASADDHMYVTEIEAEMKKLTKKIRDNKLKYRDATKSETDLMLSQASREEFATLQLAIKCSDLDAEMHAAMREYADMLVLAEANDPAALVTIGPCRNNLTQLRLRSLELHSQHKVLVSQCEANSQKRQDSGKLAAEVRVKATTAGEAKSFYIIAMLKKVVMMRSTGLRYLADYSKAQKALYEELETEEEARKKGARLVYVLAEGMRKDQDNGIIARTVEAAEKQTKNKDHFVPSETELEEERIEDEAMAIEERKKRRQFVPDGVLYESTTRPRPVIVAFARDVPAYSKQRIHKEVTRQMPGLFTSLDIKHNMGLHLQSLQTVLDAQKSVIMNVDHGLTKLTRTNFLKNLDMTLNALVPKPFVIMIVGDEDNKRMPGGSESFGVNNIDLDLMRDKDIKIGLESMVYSCEQLTHHFDQMIATADEIVPPSFSYVVMIEALYIIHSNVRTVRRPDDNITAVSWRSLRLLLAHPQELITHLRSIKRGVADLPMCELVSAYVNHKYWPPVTGEERKGDMVLHCLSVFVEQWVTSERDTLVKHGVPNQLLYKSTVKGIHSVVNVIDGVDPEDNVRTENNCGWRMPAAQVVRGALVDMRVGKNVLKIDSTLYNLSIYRERETVYFDVYDPATSLVFLETAQASEIPNLLRPNGFGISKGIDVKPPMSGKEMYGRLSKLLRFEKVSKASNARMRLVCRREYTFLQNKMAKIDGHRALLTCFEGALGELYFSAYVPEYSCTLTLLIGEFIRGRLLKDADIEFEKKSAEAEDATSSLPYVLDRLRIAPSRTVYTLQELSNQADGQHDPRTAVGMDKTMGLSLRCRCVGGAGKLLLNRVLEFCKVPHLLTLKTSTPTKTLMITIYEPRTSHTMRLRISPFQRDLIFGTMSDDLNIILQPLLKRLKFDWRGDHKVFFDSFIYRSVRKIAGSRRMVVSVELVDEQSVRLVLDDSQISEKFSTVVTKEQLVKLVHYTPPGDVIKAKFNAQSVVDAKPGVGSILGGITNKLLHSADGQDDSSVVSELSNGNAVVPKLELKLFDIPLKELLQNKANLVNICDKLQHVVRPIDPASLLAGYTAEEPSAMVFLAHSPGYAAGDDEPGEERLMNTVLRHTPWLKHGPRVNSVEGVLSSRRQVPILSMEAALNDLAQEKADAAADLAAEHARIAQELFISTQQLEKEELDAAAPLAAQEAASSLLDSIELKAINRKAERQTPGLTQDMKRALLMNADGRTTQMISADELSVVQREILIEGGERLIFERGCRTNYREGKARWHGHVSVKVFEGVCWMGEDGVGRRFRFQVYEPNVGKYFEGVVKSTKHLREILGLHAQDLLQKKKATEMLLFVIKYRMDMVKNTVNWDGSPVDEDDEDTPEFRIEFQLDRLYSDQKVTPINLADDADEEANSNKLIDTSLEHSRGKKILRMARRVSGLLMQLTVFEIPTPENLKPKKTLEQKQALLKANITVPIPRADNSSALAEQPLDVEKGFAETRTQRHNVDSREAPTLRVLGYDPRSKRKSVLIVVPDACQEVAGGQYSPYLESDRRREMARIVCEALLLYFPRGKPFELTLPWSGAAQEVTNAMAGDGKTSWRSSADRVNKRPGKLFRSALKINSLELVVTFYSQVTTKTISTDGVEVEGTTISDTKIERTVVCNHLIANFYSVAASEAFELLVTEDEQVERIKRPAAKYEEGAIRAAALRRLSRFFKAKLAEDPEDDKKKVLVITLLPPGRDFVSEYEQIRPNDAPGEDVRPVGVPAVFMPLDTCGVQLFRQGIARRVETGSTSSNLDRSEEHKRRKGDPEKDFIVTVYTKSEQEGAERGLVVKIYEKISSHTIVLHIGPSELMRLCEKEREFDLLRDMVTARESSNMHTVDAIEEAFVAVTTKGEELAVSNRFQDRLVSIVINDIAIRMDAEGKMTAYLISAPRGIAPI